MITKIEYKKVVTIDMSERELNEYGMLGWDNYYNIGNCYFFKRQSEKAEINPLTHVANVRNNGNKSRQ